MPDDPAALDTALLEGRALVECPGSPVRPAVRSIAEKVVGAPVDRAGAAAEVADQPLNSSDNPPTV